MITAHLAPSVPAHLQHYDRPRLLGITLAIFGVATAICFVVLSAVFNFPDILRDKGANVLPLYAEKASIVRPTYWILAMSGLALIACAVELGRFLAPYAAGPARLVSGFGVATGVFWSLGYSRWPIAMPYLSDLYQTGDKTRAAELYELLNRYAGMTVGEHLGFICMGVFAVVLAVALRKAGIGPKWFFPVGIFSGVLIAATAYEQYNNIELIGQINGFANTIWFIWLIAIGIVLARRSGTSPARS
jgi:Domain of unknown function (DUF4386)